MKKPWFILIGGLILACAGFVCMFAFATASQRSLTHADKPEMAWLKQEYRLSNEQYTQVCRLYAIYHPQCMEMCREIDEKNVRLKKLLAATNTVTPEIQQALADVAGLRAKCQANMLTHFYAVSQAMPPEESRRYLVWVQQETLIPAPMSEQNQTINK